MKGLKSIFRNLGSSLTKTTYFILMVIAVLSPEKGLTQTAKKNVFAFGAQFGSKYSAFQMTYHRVIASRFEVVGILNREDWKIQKLNTISSVDIREKELAASSNTFGIGGEFSFQNEPGGFFIQGNLLLRQTLWVGKVNAKFEEEAPAMISSNFIFGSYLIPADDGFRIVEYQEAIKSLEFDGKVGYKLITKGGNAFFKTFIGLTSKPGDGKEKEFNYQSQKITFNPTAALGKIGVYLGAQWGLMF